MDEPPPLPSPSAPPVAKDPSLTSAPAKGRLFPCLRCGAKVEFDPRSRSLKCPYCGFEQSIEADADATVAERDFDAYAAKLSRGSVRGIAGLETQVRCPGCGAVVLVEDRVVTENCPFCSTHFENKPEHAEGMVEPESVIPFGVDLRAARESFVTWLHSLWFAPTELRKVANLGRLVGVYIPYWTYDAMTYTRYSGRRGDDYTDTETYTDRDAQGNSVTRTRTVTKTNWYSVSGEVQHFFDDVLVCGSKSVPYHLVRGMEPWQLAELEPFKAEYLAGMKTERYAVDLKDGLGVAKQMMEPTIERLIRQDIGGDHQSITSQDTRYLAVTFKHCLLPVWVANYHYHDKLFQILVNGRSGKVSGERPWSWMKIGRLVAAVIVVVALVVALVFSMQKAKSAPKPGPPGPPALPGAPARSARRAGSVSDRRKPTSGREAEKRSRLAKTQPDSHRTT